MGNAIQIGKETPTPNLLNLFYALENGTAKAGEYITDKALGSGEHLIFDSGLEEIRGIFICDSETTDNSRQNDITLYRFIFLKNGDIINYGDSGGIIRGTIRVDGGKLYVTPTFSSNSNYTPFYPGHKYVWVAW